MAWLAVASGFALLAAPQQPQTRIEGTVIDGLCAPVANAEVRAFVRDREVASARTDASGAFVLAGLPHDVAIVQARAKGLAIAVARADLTGDDFAAPRLQCFAARTITGRVLAAGVPVAGAQVVADVDGVAGLADAPPLAITDADGRYRLDSVVIGPAVVRAWASGRQLGEAWNNGPGDAELDVALDGTPAELVVRIVNATQAQLDAAQVCVQAVDAGGDDRLALPPALSVGKPDHEGVVRFVGWPRERATARIVARIPDAVVEPWRLQRAAHTDGDNVFVVQFPKARLVRGQLSGRDGVPIAHRRLLMQPLDEAPWSFAVVHGETDEHGAFAMPCPVSEADEFALRLVDDRSVVHEQRGAWYVSKAHSSLTTPHLIDVAPAFNLRAVLHTPTGAPLANARIVVTGRSVGTYHPVGDGQTRADGTVEILGLATEGYRDLDIAVESPRWVCARVALPAGAPVAELVAKALQPAGSIRGTVLTSDGKPVPGARVRRSLALRRAVEPTVTDADGRFRFDGVLAGRHDLAVAGRRVPIDVEAGKEAAVVIQ